MMSRERFEEKNATGSGGGREFGLRKSCRARPNYGPARDGLSNGSKRALSHKHPYPHRDGIAAVAVYDEFYNPERSQQ
jgi:hypothetical protein